MERPYRSPTAHLGVWSSGMRCERSRVRDGGMYPVDRGARAGIWSGRNQAPATRGRSSVMGSGSGCWVRLIPRRSYGRTTGWPRSFGSRTRSESRRSATITSLPDVARPRGSARCCAECVYVHIDRRWQVSGCRSDDVGTVDPAGAGCRRVRGRVRALRPCPAEVRAGRRCPHQLADDTGHVQPGRRGDRVHHPSGPLQPTGRARAPTPR